MFHPTVPFATGATFIRTEPSSERWPGRLASALPSRRRRRLLIFLGGNTFPPKMVVLPRPSARLPAPRAIIKVVVVIALVCLHELHTSLISLVAVTGATATYSSNCYFYGSFVVGPLRTTGGGLPGHPPVSEVIGLPIASAPLTCAARLGLFFCFCFLGGFICALFLGLVLAMWSFFALSFFWHFCGSCWTMCCFLLVCFARLCCFHALVAFG